jgi:alpha-glucosidase (family GH31 glycosyl hydrolase)
MEKYQFPCNPLANADSIVIGPQYRFTLLDDKVLRYEWAEDGVFEDRASTFAINRNFPKAEFRVEERKDQLDIFTATFHLTYDKQRFSPNGLYVQFPSKQTDWGAEWRYGNEPEGNLGGTARTVDMVDGRCDMGTGIISRVGYSVLDDSDSILFDGHGFVATRRPGDRIDGYLFAYGYDFKGAMKSFYAISGSQPPVPRWCLGNWWSRYHPYTEKGYLALMDEFKAKEIPLAVAVVDMDWHLVKGDNIPHSGWTGYTWNKELFPNPKRFTKGLHDRGLKVTLNDHPHAGVHHHEDIYEEMASALGHDTTRGAPILFDPTSPKFMHAYLNVLCRKLEEQGEDFRWIDWQQGPVSRIPGLDPLWPLNHFHYLDTARSQGDPQALIFSRYAGPGSHRYPVGFSGDSFATWASLVFQPEFTATASNIGYGWWSHDVGGHVGGARDDECAVRWVQFGVFSPIFRLHSTNNPWMSKEPWLYRNESEAVMRHFMQLRHRLVPYIYSMTGIGESLYLPLIQPLYWNFPSKDCAYKFPTQYYFGSSLVVAPVLQPRDRKTDLAKTRVWVPPCHHVDILTGLVYDGDQEIDMYRPLHQLPLLAAEGSIIPLDRERISANGCPNPQAFEVLVVVGRDGFFNILENSRDDEQSQAAAESQRTIPIEYDQAAGRIKVVGMGRGWTFRFISATVDPSSVRVLIDDSLSTQAQCMIESSTTPPSTVVTIPAHSNLNSLITVELGSDPRLAILDHSQLIRDLILDFQISNDLKNDIWEIIQANRPTTLKIAQLIGLQLESNWFGPLAELLLADSRREP